MPNFLTMNIFCREITAQKLTKGKFRCSRMNIDTKIGVRKKSFKKQGWKERNKKVFRAQGNAIYEQKIQIFVDR